MAAQIHNQLRDAVSVLLRYARHRQLLISQSSRCGLILATVTVHGLVGRNTKNSAVIPGG